MKDFEAIKRKCIENNSLIENVIDRFLMYYAVERSNLEPEMERNFKSFKNIINRIPEEWLKRMKAQYIVHKIFRKDGLIRNYLNQPSIKYLNLTERNFLELQSKHPWRFSFSIIKEQPAKDFFIMEDVFSSEEFLLFSPGVSIILNDQSVKLWFNLLTYNGLCWQTFGAIAAYKSFEPDDIFFFATELNPDISSSEELIENLESNPVPYMMLLSGANLPPVYNKKDMLIQVMSIYDIDSIDTRPLTKTFKSEYNEGVYRLSLKNWSKSPHFSQAYYDENQKLLLISSMTERGFNKLILGLNEYGFNLSADPLIRVNLTMLTTVSEILKRKIKLNEYEDLFSRETSESDKENMDKLNIFLGLIIPEINTGRKPDIQTLASKAGVDIATARNLVEEIMKKLGPKQNKK
jgi:hypothetical protein